MKKTLWIVWGFLSLSGIAYFSYAMFVSEDKSQYLIGETSYGHFQIEMACEACHSDAFGGMEAIQEACVGCHEDELKEAHDSHPKKKFTDPREAFRLEIVDARYCVRCHTEHKKEQTHPMGVTLPEDYCYHCHKEIGDERDSHKDLPFDSCASAGCHNFHDNRALYEDFLLKNAGQPWLSEVAKIALSNNTEALKSDPLTLSTSHYQNNIALHTEMAAEWHGSSHAQSGVDCGGCHEDDAGDAKDNKDKKGTWIEKPGLAQCESCHANEVKGFTSGKHGMRLARNNEEVAKKKMKAIKPGESSLSFHTDVELVEHGCNTCHGAHDFDRVKAASENCLGCHSDDHSLAYETSPHGHLWQQVLDGERPMEEGVSCASCHMPRVVIEAFGQEKIVVEHNQNANLRPNEKMIRPVCMNCHGLEFSIDALADEELIRNNFNGKPSKHIESVDWAKKREE